MPHLSVLSRSAPWSFLASGIAVATVACVATTSVAQDASLVTIGRTSDADRYDPQRSSSLAAAEVLYMVGDTLVTLSDDLKTVEPALAESWEVSEDGLTYTFHLKDGVTYCDGKVLTAQHVVSSIERWLTPDGPYVSAWKAGSVDNITAPDDRTVVYKLTSPSSGLLFQMAQFNFVIIDAEQALDLGDDFGVTAFNGTGPYCFDSWRPNDEIVLTRHEGYDWGPAALGNTGPASVEKVVWKIIPEEATLVASLQAGEIDASYALPAWSIGQLDFDPSISLVQPTAAFRTHYIGMKTSRPFLQDVEIREAVSHAIDQSAIAEAIFFDTVEPATAYYAEAALDYDPTTDTAPFEFDPDATRSMLEVEGFIMGDDGYWQKDGEKLTLTYYGFNTGREQAEAIQGDLRKSGIELQVELFDSTAIWAKLREETYDLYQMDYPYLNAGDALNLYFSSASIPSPNRMMWNDPETDRLLEAGNTAVDDVTRAEAFKALGKHLHQAVLWKPLLLEKPTVAVGPRLEDFKPSGISGAAFGSGLNLVLK